VLKKVQLEPDFFSFTRGELDEKSSFEPGKESTEIAFAGSNDIYSITPPEVLANPGAAINEAFDNSRP
jgi:hypothetical protein